MSYKDLPNLNSQDFNESKIISFLEDISTRKEFQTSNNETETKIKSEFIPLPTTNLFLPGLNLSGAQTFIKNFQNPNTRFNRILIKWQTGVGKSIAAISISQEFIKQFIIRNSFGEETPNVYIISFTAKETIQEDMLKYSEFGFISQEELLELKLLREKVSISGAHSQESKHLSGYLGSIRRRITDRTRRGYYTFYGYKEFANDLFKITKVGADRKFDIQSLYGRKDSSFEEEILKEVKNGNVIINEQLLNNMANGLIIADEIHNVYNILNKNNYGIAIQYVLDKLGDRAPRAVFMSATPLTGNSSEIIDLLNLLVPKNFLPGNVSLKRSDFFSRTASDENEVYLASQLKPGAIEKIAQLAACRISFLLDTNINLYPKRIFEGETLDNVPYLKITKCPMSTLHKNTLLHEYKLRNAEFTKGLTSNTYSLNDMVFPNPDSDIGLYNSNDIYTKIMSASDDWKENTGIYVAKGSDYNISASTNIITGSFLNPESLPIYSTKYAMIMKEILATIRAGPGKIMVYHHRVRMSGVLLLQEIFKTHGFIDETSSPIDSTLCSICGIERIKHKDMPHEYIPLRFIIAHSDIDKLYMTKSIAKFNKLSNINGYQIRVILGSKIIREGLNFKAIRTQIIASLPTDYPTLIQVFGRVVRKESHIDLPQNQRNVIIKIFVSTMEEQTTPELQKYIDKGKEYLVIQEVEKALHKYAIDGFTNYENINRILNVDNKLSANIDVIPYKPVIEKSNKQINKSTFFAYGYSDIEVNIIIGICKLLFEIRPVWKYEDLWNAIKTGKIRGVNYDTSLFEEDNYALALKRLQTPIGTKMITLVDDYYILTNIRPDRTPILDIESYLRKPIIESTIKIDVSSYVKNIKSSLNWTFLISDFNKTYLSSDSKSTPELSLLEYSSTFHFRLIKELILNPEKQITIDDERMRELYRRFRIVITIADANTPISSKLFRGSKLKKPTDIIGYVTIESVILYNSIDNTWYGASHSDFAISRRYNENNIIIGFVSVDEKNVNTQDIVSGAKLKFKTRPPIQEQMTSVSKIKNSDNRNLIRGAVCETRTRDELINYYNMLMEELQKRSILFKKIERKTGGSGMQLNAQLGFLAKFNLYAKKQFPNTLELCETIKLYLLALEEESRSKLDGMTNGIRWLYLFNERVQTINI